MSHFWCLPKRDDGNVHSACFAACLISIMSRERLRKGRVFWCGNIVFLASMSGPNISLGCQNSWAHCIVGIICIVGLIVLLGADPERGRCGSTVSQWGE